MDRDKFVLKQVKRGGWTSAEEFLQYHAVDPCDCGKKKCKGWQVRWMFGAERRARATGGRIRSRPRRTSWGFVYFAQLGDLIKIGFSQDPEGRAEKLSAVLLGTCEGDREMEAKLHEEFAVLRERGEWFHADPRLLERIEALTK